MLAKFSRFGALEAVDGEVIDAVLLDFEASVTAACTSPAGVSAISLTSRLVSTSLKREARV